jgi:hypothetical protein
MASEEMSSVNRKVFTRLMVKQFLPDCILENNVIEYVLEMFRVRDKRISETYLEVNEGSGLIRDFGPRKQSLFFSFEKLLSLFESPVDINFNLPEGVPLSAFHHIYMLDQNETTIERDGLIEVCKDYGLVIVALDVRVIYYVSPSDWQVQYGPLPLHLHCRLNQIFDKFVQASESLGVDFAEWKVEIYPYYISDILESNNKDGLLWVLGIMYFVHMGCFAFMNKRIGEIFRMNLCYWALTGLLPK